MALYPDVTFKIPTTARQTAHKNFLRVVEDIFGKEYKIIYNARKEANLEKITNGVKRYYEIDVWMPTLKLGFEFQVHS